MHRVSISIVRFDFLTIKTMIKNAKLLDYPEIRIDLKVKIKLNKHN